jgi:3,4-dihydroxy 2-butanone 4-phosphate synthase/GTP cyclohydrolase II
MAIASSTTIETEFGNFNVSYHETKYGNCVSFFQGNLSKGKPIVRLHSACLFGEVFHSLHCDCYYQLTETMALIHKQEKGVIIYSYQEGRGIGLKKKIEAMEIQRTEKCDTAEAFKRIGFKKVDLRDYKAEIEALKELGLAKNIKTFSGNPQKIKALKDAGYNVVEILKIDYKKLGSLAKQEIKTKIEKMGFSYPQEIK